MRTTLKQLRRRRRRRRGALLHDVRGGAHGSACVAGAGAAGALHVFGPGAGPCDAASAREDVSEYEVRPSPVHSERVETALRDFTKWAALRRRFAKEGRVRRRLARRRGASDGGAVWDGGVAYGAQAALAPRALWSW